MTLEKNSACYALRVVCAVAVSAFLVVYRFNSAVAQEALTGSPVFSDSLDEKILIAAISAALSLLVGYTLFYIKGRKEVRRRISYSVEAKNWLPQIDEHLAGDLTVSYKGVPVRHVGYVKCHVTNSGTSVIRNQTLRFAFPERSAIIDWNIDPKPPKEAVLEEAMNAEDDVREKTFTLEHFAVHDKFTLNFVISGSDISQISVVGRNDEDDVDIVVGAVAASIDDRRVIEKFAFLCLLTLFAPGALNVVPEFGYIAVGVYYVVVAWLAVQLIPSVARIAAEYFVQSSDPASLSEGGVIYSAGSLSSIAVGGASWLKVVHPLADEELADENAQIADATLSGIPKESRALLEMIHSSGGEKTVNDLFPGFAREESAHNSLRDLRNRKLIRPAEGGRWERQKHPVLTKSAETLWRSRAVEKS